MSARDILGILEAAGELSLIFGMAEGSLWRLENSVTDTMSTKWSLPGPAAVPRAESEDLFLQDRKSQLWEERHPRTQDSGWTLLQSCWSPVWASPRQRQTSLWGLISLPHMVSEPGFPPSTLSAGQLPAPGARKERWGGKWPRHSCLACQAQLPGALGLGCLSAN